MVQSILSLMLVSVTALLTPVWTSFSNTLSDPNSTVRNTEVSDILSSSTACDFVYGFDIQNIFGIKSDVIGEEKLKVEKLSTCAYRWTNVKDGSEENLELWIEINPDKTGEKFSKDLKETLITGELRHPMKPEEGVIRYEKVDGPGDMSIWSSEERALRWHLSDNYYFIINLDEKRSPRSPEADLKCLMKLASQVNQRLGI